MTAGHLTTAPPATITRVTFYRQRGAWCYAAWACDAFDHSDVVDVRDGATEADARGQLAAEFPVAIVDRVADLETP